MVTCLSKELELTSCPAISRPPNDLNMAINAPVVLDPMKRKK